MPRSDGPFRHWRKDTVDSKCDQLLTGGDYRRGAKSIRSGSCVVRFCKTFGFGNRGCLGRVQGGGYGDAALSRLRNVVNDVVTAIWRVGAWGVKEA